MNAERKASVEVVEVTGAHQCRARVTEIKNAVRRPLVAGDQLYNPAWAPGMRDHVAVAGVIDLTGDGRDSTAAFVQALEKDGVIVDAWLDLKELAVNGKGISLQTSYLIIGYLPDLQNGDQSDPRKERVVAIHEAVHKLREQAEQKGVTVVGVRRYMALAGMKLPLPVRESDETKSTTTRNKQ